jgi:hypothetical protein
VLRPSKTERIEPALRARDLRKRKVSGHFIMRFSERGRKMDTTQEQIRDVLTAMAVNANNALHSMIQDDVAATWFWRWDKYASIEHNICEFSDDLEAYKRRCRKWEDHHNGGVCVVERVRDKYLMPKVREFLAELAAHQDQVKPLLIQQAGEIERLRSALLAVKTWDVDNAFRSLSTTGSCKFTLPESLQRQVQAALGSEDLDGNH